MRVQCSQCGTGGNIPDAKIPAAGRKIVCPKCKTPFFVHKEAQRTAQQGITGQDAVRHYQEGVQLLKGKQIDAAIEKFNAAIQLNPEYGEAYRYLGLAYGQKNLWEDARQILQKAIAHTPDDFLSLKNLGVAYLRLKRFAEAEQILLQAVQYAPDDQKVLSFLIMAAQGRKQEQLSDDIPQQPSSSGKHHVEEGSTSERTISDARDDVTPQRNPVKELLDKGVVSLDNNQYNRAIEAFQEVTRLAPNESDGYFGLGMVYEKRKEWPKAMNAYEKAVELNPEDQVAKDNLRFVKKQKKKFRLAFWRKRS